MDEIEKHRLKREDAYARAIARTPEADAGRKCKGNCREKTQKTQKGLDAILCEYSFAFFAFFCGNSSALKS